VHWVSVLCEVVLVGAFSIINDEDVICVTGVEQYLFGIYEGINDDKVAYSECQWTLQFVSSSKTLYQLFWADVVLEVQLFIRGQLKCDGTHAETRFRLSAKRTSPFKSAGVSVWSTTGSRGVRISGSNTGHTMFRGSVNGWWLRHAAVKVKFTLEQDTRAQRGSRGISLLFL